MKKETAAERIRRELREEVESLKKAYTAPRAEWQTWEDFQKAVIDSESYEQIKMSIL